MPDPYGLALGGQRAIVAERAARISGREIVIPGLRGHPDIPKYGPWDKEFDRGMPSGYTVTNAPTAWDCNKTVPGHLFMNVAADNTIHWITWPSPATPFTVICKLSALEWYPATANNSQQPSLIISTATPNTGSAHTLGIWTIGDGTANTRPQAAGTSLASTPGYGLHPPVYLKIVATSNTNVASYFSFDGILWTLISSGVNPGFTIGSMGLQGRITGSAPSAGNKMAWQFLRVTTP